MRRRADRNPDRKRLTIKRRLPNALSVSRIVLGLIVVSISGHVGRGSFLLTVGAASLAMVTDWLDGHLARRWRITSDAGYVLDAMGDRAIHLAFLLVIFARYSIHPLLLWVIIFRDIAIYAIRLLSKEWFRKSAELRWISLFHATGIRIWIGLFLIRDALRIFTNSDSLNVPAFKVIQMAMLCIIIVISYWGLLQSLRWLIDKNEIPG